MALSLPGALATQFWWIKEAKVVSILLFLSVVILF